AAFDPRRPLRPYLLDLTIRASTAVGSLPTAPGVPAAHSSRLRAAPLEVGHEVVRVGLGISVLRLEPELEVVRVGHGEERRTAPPPGRRETTGLAQRRRPQMRPRKYQHDRSARESGHGGARYIPVVQPAAAPAGPRHPDRDNARRGPAGSVRP